MSKTIPMLPLARSASLVRAGRRAIGSRVGRLVALLRQIWRRSLQFRMVTITLVASGLLVGAFGYLVAQRSVDILLDKTVADVQAQADSDVKYATDQLTYHGQAADPGLKDTLNTTAVYLAGSPEREGATIVAFKSKAVASLGITASRSGNVAPLITPEMERRVAVDGEVAHQIRTADIAGTGPVKYLVYGSPVPTRFGQVEIYYLVPLTTQDAIARGIQATVLVTGLALVILLVVLANLVTRLVVNPVRVAARTAQRLSAGLLDQRMVVQGEDELAQLAASFNQMAANLQRQIVRLEEMSRLQRRFTSDVSHELRTPLTTVRMAADLLFSERGEFEPAVARSAELLQAELDRFESLLTDLLEISRFDAGFAMLDAEPTDLGLVARRVADRFAGLAERAGVELRLFIPDNPVIVEVDPRRVERVLRNLVGNAVEHAEGKPVDVTLCADDAAVAIAVRDRGVGLRPGEEKLVFSRFWRADPSRARQTGGTGLGLSISLEDARLHGGWLEAWGAPGRGAQFRLTLPLRAGDRLVSSPLKLVPADDAIDPAPAGQSTAGGAADVPSGAGGARSAGRAAAGDGAGGGVRSGGGPETGNGAGAGAGGDAAAGDGVGGGVRSSGGGAGAGGGGLGSSGGGSGSGGAGTGGSGARSSGGDGAGSGGGEPGKRSEVIA